MKSQGFEGNCTKNFIEKVESNIIKLLKMGFSFKFVMWLVIIQIDFEILNLLLKFEIPFACDEDKYDEYFS